MNLNIGPGLLTQWSREGKYNNVNGYRGPEGTMVNSFECDISKWLVPPSSNRLLPCKNRVIMCIFFKRDFKSGPYLKNRKKPNTNNSNKKHLLVFLA